MTDVDPNLGRRLSNRYDLVSLLGYGSMGRVYEARDMLLGGVPVAVKFLSQTLLNNRMRQRFEREAMTCALLGQRSIHIVRVTDYGVNEDEIPYYVMECLKGQNLSEIASRQSLTIPRFLSLIRQICLGLQCAHQGILIEQEVCPIIHRDIKPSNILIVQDESLGELAKILDFGIAKLLQEDAGATNCFMGTLPYSSPEQMEGRELDPRSDIYSLGIMMFQLLSGKMPLHVDTHTFGGWYKAHHHQMPRSFQSVNADLKIPKVLESLIMSCLEKSPGDRPQSVVEILKALEPLEQRFGTGRQIGQRIGEALSKVQVTPHQPTDRISGSTKGVCALATWPKTMPIADIVFPNLIKTDEGHQATLWVMLPHDEIQKRASCTRYNQFLFLEAPHPMMLWLTVLYSTLAGPKWMPSYLDLKSPQGQQIARVLCNTGEYKILLFSQENPNHCASMLTSTIADPQRRLMQVWISTSQLSNTTSHASLSKNILKAELEKLKPKVLMKLESIYNTVDQDLSG